MNTNMVIIFWKACITLFVNDIYHESLSLIFIGSWWDNQGEQKAQPQPEAFSYLAIKFLHLLLPL